MGVVICLPLYGSPDRELEEGIELRGRHLRDLAAGLQQRLLQAADILDKLTAAGWSAKAAAYDALLSRPGVETKEDAVRSLTALGVSPEELLIVEEVDEEDGGTA